jgi:hypothetical protein
MKRYDLYVNTEFDSISAGMEEQHDGEYVKWEDVQNKIREMIDDDFIQVYIIREIEREFEL